MGNAVTNWVFRRPKFCCCLPVRIGAGILSFLSMALGGLLAVSLWIEVGSDHFMSKELKAIYVAAGFIESLLFVASVIGFIGVWTRKQLFVIIYAAFLYFHFLLNLGIAIYLLWQVTHATNVDIMEACYKAIQNPQAQKQCKDFLNITKGVIWAVIVLFLSIEAYCALVVTRYVNQLRYEKRDVRKSRMIHRQSAYDAFHKRFTSMDGREALMNDFNPYEDYSPTTSPKLQFNTNTDEEDKNGTVWSPPAVFDEEKVGLVSGEQSAPSPGYNDPNAKSPIGILPHDGLPPASKL